MCNQAWAPQATHCIVCLGQDFQIEGQKVRSNWFKQTCIWKVQAVLGQRISSIVMGSPISAPHSVLVLFQTLSFCWGEDDHQLASHPTQWEKKNVLLSQPLQQNIWNRVSLPLIGQSWVNPGPFSALTRPRLHGNAGTTGAGERGDQLCSKLFFPRRKQGNYQQEEWTVTIQINHQELWINELLCLCFLR